MIQYAVSLRAADVRAVAALLPADGRILEPLLETRVRVPISFGTRTPIIVRVFDR